MHGAPAVLSESRYTARMKIATWNVNSLRMRMPHLLPWLAEHKPDIVCLQETKIIDADFPNADCKAVDYEVVYHGQKSYNGVAILTRPPAVDVVRGIPGYSDEQCRVIAASFNDVRVVNVYVPNGQAVGSEKYVYKLAWLEALHDYLTNVLQEHARVLVLGDFNIAPAAIDVHDPVTWDGSVMVSTAERAAFADILALGFSDLFRELSPFETAFSWWDYRQGAFRRNLGLRIDHILASAALRARCTACTIDKAPRRLPRPSDHAPVLAEFDL